MLSIYSLHIYIKVFSNHQEIPRGHSPKNSLKVGMTINSPTLWQQRRNTVLYSWQCLLLAWC